MLIHLVGDVIGRPGREFLRRAMPVVRRTFAPDFIVVNGENSAAGHGITPATAKAIFRCGADVITSGNHVWDRREIVDQLGRNDRILRPLNYPPDSPGRGFSVQQTSDGVRVGVLNLMGRVFMPNVDDPFRAADRALEELGEIADLVLVDFHAETTSEKMALGWHLDGRVTALVGTHTHVPTADARILPQGAAYVSDLGMTGSYDSVIGMDKHSALERFLTQRPVRFKPAEGDVRLNSVLVEADPTTGRASSIRRLDWSEQDLEEAS